MNDRPSRQLNLCHRLGQVETVLVVDDEAATLALTRQALERAGYRVLCASDGIRSTRSIPS
jgi:CheY-like chemotaxis protein